MASVDVAPKAIAAEAVGAPEAGAAVPETQADRTAAQHAWLNFVAKVRRGEQLDPTGQYVKDGTMLPADGLPHRRLKLDVTKDKFPFTLYADGTTKLLAKALVNSKNTQSLNGDDEIPPETPCHGIGDCPSYNVPPTPISTFTTSVGQGGSGYIVDLKVMINKPIIPDYVRLDADLNKGAGGDYIYFHFTRNPNAVRRGIEYDKGSGYTNAMPVVRFETANGSFTSLPPTPAYCWPIWSPNQNPNVYWDRIDLNGGAGGAYVYSYQSKDDTVLNPDRTVSYYTGFSEIGILSGNSDQIQPPAGWQRYPADLNEGAGGDYIYFCYRR